jgi:uncharacterized beta-barrel protein YwiB (DUF1934 family)
LTLKNTKKNAKIHICNIQSAAGDSDTIEMTVEGAFYQKEGSFYLLYREPDPETGTGDSVMLKASGGSVIMKRTGAVFSEMRFEAGKKDICQYQMPYGTMEIGLLCRSAEISLSEHGGWIKLNYILQIGGGQYSNNLTIKVEAGKEYI